jgi:hypothetical protein
MVREDGDLLGYRARLQSDRMWEEHSGRGHCKGMRRC